jgi:hypothetical protein
MISSNIYSSKRHIQDCICYRLGGFKMENDVVWNEKMDLQLIREVLPKHSENIWTIL